jgi:AcrR family transcriptional regulator
LPAELQWIRPPAQGRSQRTLDRLLDAVEALLAERPFDQVSVQEIVQRAGSSIGAFYGRFPHKEAVLHALHERYVAESRATNELAFAPSQWEGVPLRDIVEAFCRFVVGFQRERAGLRRALVVAQTQLPLIRARSVVLAGEVVGRIAALLRSRAHEHDHPDPERAADFVHRLVFSMLDQQVLFGAASPTGGPLTDPELVAELTRALSRYLGIRPAESADDPNEVRRP